MRCMYQKEEKGGRGIERDIVRIKKMKYNKNRSRKEGRGMACKKERRVLLGKEVEVEVEALPTHLLLSAMLYRAHTIKGSQRL